MVDTPQKAAIEALELARQGIEIHEPDAPEYKVCAALIEALTTLRANQGCEVTEIDAPVVAAIQKMKDGRIDYISMKEITAVWLFAEHCLSEKYPNGLRIVQTDKGEG